MGMIDTAKEWLVGVALKKGIQNVVKVGVAGLLSLGVVKESGVDSKTAELILATIGTALLSGLLEFGRNWLKQKFPKLSWL